MQCCADIKKRTVALGNSPLLLDSDLLFIRRRTVRSDMNDAVLDFYSDALVALLALCNAVFDALCLKQRRRTERAASIHFFDRIFVCFLFYIVHLFSCSFIFLSPPDHCSAPYLDFMTENVSSEMQCSIRQASCSATADETPSATKNLVSTIWRSYTFAATVLPSFVNAMRWSL